MRDAQIRRVVVVGASVAGLSAADALREAGFEGSIEIVGAESHPPYDRPPLSKQALHRDDSRDAFFPLRSEEHYSEKQLDLILGREAVRLDAQKRKVELDDGTSLAFDGLVIATGCRARTLTTRLGNALPVLRTLDDARWLCASADQHRHAILIGAGFIGLEVAASLRGRGLDVTVLEASPAPLSNGLGTELADWLCAYHAAHGVRIESGVQIESVEGCEGDYEVFLSDGRRFSAGLVLAGVGVTPNVEWLKGSGLDHPGGVLCDAAGSTAQPSIVAAGDVACMQLPGGANVSRIEHWTHAMNQGRAAARHLLLGETTSASVPYFWTDQFDRKLQGYGRRQPGDVVRFVEGSLESGEFLAAFGAGESFHGILSSGRARSIRTYRKLLERGGTWSEVLAAGDAVDLAGSNSQKQT